MKRFIIFIMALILSAMSFSANAQYRISFRIVDSNGDPVIGATAVIKGTTQGAVADVDGYIRLDVPNEGTIITISCVGYESIDVVARLLHGTFVLRDDGKSVSGRQTVLLSTLKTTRFARKI